ncbi:uncharacterized protein K441DRAFT_576855, partial [Cenococcum geophilum 1.58]|uniref:uncharacterized protein n=1 Tax=Cenococcum geophilum 1.58 TaxID=794803 RepID=UPI00358EA192
INYILYNALNDYCTAYLNNVLIFSKTRAEYTKYVNEININKSKFYSTKIKYLGLIILTNGMTMDPKKI